MTPGELQFPRLVLTLKVEASASARYRHPPKEPLRGSRSNRWIGTRPTLGGETIELILLLLGGVIGGVVNYLFERRALRQSRQENERLRGELDRLRSTILSLGGEEPGTTTSGTAVDPSLPDRVLARARMLQDADGRVRVNQLTGQFVADGVPVTEVRAILVALADQGRLEQEGTWLRLR